MIDPKRYRGRQRSEGASSPMNILVVVIDSQDLEARACAASVRGSRFVGAIL